MGRFKEVLNIWRLAVLILTLAYDTEAGKLATLLFFHQKCVWYFHPMFNPRTSFVHVFLKNVYITIDT